MDLKKEMGSNFISNKQATTKKYESILVFNRPINEVKNDFSKILGY